MLEGEHLLGQLGLQLFVGLGFVQNNGQGGIRGREMSPEGD